VANLRGAAAGPATSDRRPRDFERTHEIVSQNVNLRLRIQEASDQSAETLLRVGGNLRIAKGTSDQIKFDWISTNPEKPSEIDTLVVRPK